mgnify:FL=1
MRAVQLSGTAFCLSDFLLKIIDLTVALFDSKFYFCIEFGVKMTEDHKRLLAVFEVRVRDLMALCDKQKCQIDELTDALNQKTEELQQAKDEIVRLNTKCDNMLTARVVSVDEGDVRSARLRLSKLVREVEKCIALLNE